MSLVLMIALWLGIQQNPQPTQLPLTHNNVISQEVQSVPQAPHTTYKAPALPAAVSAQVAAPQAAQAPQVLKDDNISSCQSYTSCLNVKYGLNNNGGQDGYMAVCPDGTPAQGSCATPGDEK